MGRKLLHDKYDERRSLGLFRNAFADAHPHFGALQNRFKGLNPYHWLGASHIVLVIG